MTRRYTDLIRPEDLQQLTINRQRQAPVQGTKKEIDFDPVCLLRVAGTDMMWMLTEIDDDMIAFGGAQIFVFELGSTWLDELLDVDVRGIRVMQDTNFKPTTTLSGYAQMARERGGLLVI